MSEVLTDPAVLTPSAWSPMSARISSDGTTLPRKAPWEVLAASTRRERDG